MGENISKAGNSWFARIYRGEWVGSRSFAFRQYGGRDHAYALAERWVCYAEEKLPLIPEKPVLRKATVHLVEDYQRNGLYYYDVYLPPVKGENTWSQKYYFKDLDEQVKARDLAYNLELSKNRELLQIHRIELAEWYVQHDEIMEEILRLWPGVKSVQL